MKSNAFVHLFKTPLNYYMYDVNKNAIVRIDKSVYDYLQNTEGPEPEQMAKLRQEGYLSEKRPKKIEHPMTRRLEHELNNNIEQMTLQVTKQCNFRCAYCVYGEVAFDLQRRHDSDFMTYETAKKAIDFYAQHSKDQTEAIIAFYGGEPLLAYPLIEKAILYSEEVLKGKKILFSMTTNASLLTPEKARFLFEHNCHVLVSLDGPSEVQNASRRFAIDGKGSFDIVYHNLQRIIEDVPDAISHLSINSVIDLRNKYEDVIHFFETDPLIKNIPSQRNMEDDSYFIEKSYATDNYVIECEKQRLLAFLDRFHLCPESVASRVAKQDLEKSMTRIVKWMEGTPDITDTISPSGPCIPGQRRAFVNAEGEIFPCERVSETSEIFKIGDIDNGFNLEAAKKLLNIGQLTEEDCKKCWALRQCYLCAKHCDNAGEFSASAKRRHCKDVYNNVEQNFRLYVLAHEMIQRYS